MAFIPRPGFEESSLLLWGAVTCTRWHLFSVFNPYQASYSSGLKRTTYAAFLEQPTANGSLYLNLANTDGNAALWMFLSQPFDFSSSKEPWQVAACQVVCRTLSGDCS